jgi:hypothetical protein
MKKDDMHNRPGRIDAHFSPVYPAFGTFVGLALGIAFINWMDSAVGPNESRPDNFGGDPGQGKETLEVGEVAAVNDPLLQKQPPAPIRAMTIVNASGVTPMEEAIAAARQAVNRMGQVDEDRLVDPGTRTFGDDPATQVSVRAMEDRKVSLGPGDGSADWALVMGEEVGHPVGYETIKAHPDVFTLFGTRFFANAVAVDEFETISGNTLTDNDTDFGALLTDGVSYAIELEGGTMNGKVLKVTSFSDSELTVEESLPPESGINYVLRPALHLSDLFDNHPGLLKVDNFNPDSGDLILLPSGDGHFHRYFYSSYPGLEGLFNATTGLAEDPELVSTEGLLFLHRGATPLDIVISGSVKLKDTLLTVADTFNYFSSMYPAGETLGVSNLEASLQAGTAATADLVWMEVGAGVYQQYFYSDGTPPLTVGWREVGAGDTSMENVAFSSGFAIHRRAASPYDALLTPPSFYSDL